MRTYVIPGEEINMDEVLAELCQYDADLETAAARIRTWDVVFCLTRAYFREQCPTGQEGETK